MSDPVANAVCRKWNELPIEAINIILDVDPEVCRMGFGTITTHTLSFQMIPLTDIVFEIDLLIQSSSHRPLY